MVWTLSCHILIWHRAVFPHGMSPILSLFLYDTGQCFPLHDPYLVTILIWHRAVFPRAWLYLVSVSHGMTPILLLLYDTRQCFQWENLYIVTILVWHRAVFPMAWLLSCHYSCMTQGSVSHGMTPILSLFLYDTGQCFPWHDSDLVTILVWHRAVFPMA